MSIASKVVGDPSRMGELIGANPQKATAVVGGTLTFQSLAEDEQLRLPVTWPIVPIKHHAPGPTPSGPSAFFVAPGNQTVIVLANGALLTLPVGAVWVSGVPAQYVGTSTLILIPSPPASPETDTITWMDAAGVTQTTFLTILARGAPRVGYSADRVNSIPG